MKFVALDIETANSSSASICQIGAVTFNEGKVIEVWEALINPEDYFDPINVSIHHIDKKAVQNAPTFPEIVGTLRNIIANQIVVSHSLFDRNSINAALDKYKLPQIDSIWLDSTKVVRRTWLQFSHKGYGLKNVCEFIGVDFRHHDAKEDARAAGEILLRAIAETGICLKDWLTKINNCGSTQKIIREVNPNGPFFGEIAVFTGTLSVSRREAINKAAKAGLDIATSVNKDTTILIVGDQDIKKLAGHEKSLKQRKAEELIAKGQLIRIIGETDFLQIINM